jgi:hypothetical protein
MPDVATPLQRAQLLAALSAGSEIIRLRGFACGIEDDAGLGRALAAIARGKSAHATTHLARLDAALAIRADPAPRAQHILRMRSSVLALSEVLTLHADYFDAEASR